MKYVLVCLLLTGCATMERDIERASDACRAMGHQDGSESMRACVQSMVQSERANRARQSAAILSQPKPTTCTTFGNTVRCQ